MPLAFPIPPCPQLPPSVARALFTGSCGEARLLQLAEMLMPHLENTPELLAVFRDLALAAWETDPLSANAARIAHSVHAQSPFLAPNTAAFAATCAALRPADREIPPLVNECLRGGDLETAKTLVERSAVADPGNLFWHQFAAYFGIQLGELDWYEPWLAAPPMPPEFALAFKADYLFAREEYAAAAALYEEAFSRTGMPGWLVREGECRFRLGDREAAGRRWQQALEQRPWQTSLRLRFADLERGADIPGAAPPGKGEVLLYTWNHGSDLARALEALNASQLGDAGLTVLDNGSTDATPDILGAWADRFGSRMRIVTLPVNIGAPAARNWLLSLESVKCADWAVFLDDDALLPPDWAGYFGTALRLHPEAGIIGCRVVDMVAPMTAQSVDLFFEPQTAPGPDQGAVTVTHFHARTPDFGQYAYLRYAASVTGCCHLLTRANIDAVGAFDLRFSPSQMDDVERDVRSCTKGHFPLYQGHLRVRHIKRSGLGMASAPWLVANCAGNAEKLKRSYAKETLLGFTDAIREQLF